MSLQPADRALAEQLRQATGPNYQLGLDVIAAFVEGDPRLWMSTRGDPTVSIDSIVALVRKLDPGAEIAVQVYQDGRGGGDIWMPFRSRWFRERASTPALALCLALVLWRDANG